MSGDERKLNPQIRDAEMGIKDLRKIKIYPMSMADQKKLGGILQGVLEAYFKETVDGGLTEDNMIPFIKTITQILSDNIQEVLKIVTDLSESEINSFFEYTSNLQMARIVEIVVEENFEEPSKNVRSLYTRIQDLFQLERQSPPSSNDTPNMISATSTEEATEMED